MYDRPCEGTEPGDRFRFTFSRDAGTIKSFVNELTLIANGFASACITVGMPRNFAFIRENALTNNRIDVNERFELDEKVSRGNKLMTGVYAMSSLSSKSEQNNPSFIYQALLCVHQAIFASICAILRHYLYCPIFFIISFQAYIIILK